jgi:hypothetical protein
MATATRGRPRVTRSTAKSGVTVTGKTFYTGVRLTFAERKLLEAYASQTASGSLTDAFRDLLTLGLQAAQEQGLKITAAQEAQT